MTASRNEFLDVLKGGAIILVVLGHVVQASPDYDAQWGFRLIYAFHMAFFMFLAGATAALGFRPSVQETVGAILRGMGQMVGIRARRLLLPFAGWALVHYVHVHVYETQSLLAYARMLLIQWDYGLWFLVSLFFCNLTLVLTTGICSLLGARYDPRRFAVVLVALFLAVNIMKDVPYVWGNIRGHMIFFTAGFLVMRYWAELLALLARLKIALPVVRILGLLCVPLYLLFSYYWVRVGNSPIAGLFAPFLGQALAETLFRIGTALCGIMAFSALGWFLYRALPWLGRPLAYTGQKTLEIYAMSGFFFGMGFLTLPAAVIGPMLVALPLSYLPVVSPLLLGVPARRFPFRPSP